MICMFVWFHFRDALKIITILDIKLTENCKGLFIAYLVLNNFHWFDVNSSFNDATKTILISI